MDTITDSVVKTSAAPTVFLVIGFFVSVVLLPVDSSVGHWIGWGTGSVLSSLIAVVHRVNERATRERARGKFLPRPVLNRLVATTLICSLAVGAGHIYYLKRVVETMW